MIIQNINKTLIAAIFPLFIFTGNPDYEAIEPSGQPELVHLSIASKKTVRSSPSMTVTWCTSPTKGRQYVKYGSTPDLELGSGGKRKESDNGLIWTSVLKNLENNTKYFYKCGSDASGWSPLYSFVTEPEYNSTTSFRTGIFGDTQNNANNEEFQKTRHIAGLMQTYSPAFTLHMGDIVDNGSDAASWKGFLSVTQELNAAVPLMPVPGNHDVENKPGDNFQSPFPAYYDLFNLPGNEVNYSFTYKNVRFIAVFSGAAEAASKTGQVRYQPGSPEYVWLDKELSMAEADKDVLWIVVFMHYPLNSFGWSNIKLWKESLLPLIEKHRVDLCLAGHRHVYERHLQMKNGIPVPSDSNNTYTSGKGTVFITLGTAGGNPTETGGKEMPSMVFTPDEKMYSFGIMDISNESITLRVFSQDNIMTDWVTIHK
ncbi:MAG: metallophosphoesterase family protein [Bacteroidales bacterium]|nr:metallophosphoesterase family protein [Bacteroidales bacterium]